MNPEKVIFGFFIVLALTLNVGFVMGDMSNPEHHHTLEFVAALVVNLIATLLKFGDRSQVGAVLLSTSLVADLQLIAAAVTWIFVGYVDTWTIEIAMPSIVSLATGAVVANVVSVLLLVVETITLGR